MTRATLDNVRWALEMNQSGRQESLLYSDEQ